ncbi:MAG: chorismate synthase [Clostridia bacterium]|nr:chorismate synthase [Clostridia bacterium]
MITLTTAGESHGKGLFAIIEGIPQGLKIDLEKINAELLRRQSGYGRGARQKIESDKVEILSGVRNLTTLGSPVTLAVWNRDYENWKEFMAAEGCNVEARKVENVRPGHADLAGMKKFGVSDARNILERASARETAVRVAAGEIFRQLLEALNIEVTGFVRSVGTSIDKATYSFDEIQKGRSKDLCMLDRKVEERAKKEIDSCKEEGDTLGGVLELRVNGLKCGFGSPMTYREKLDARIASALMSVQAVKGVEVGAGFSLAAMKGSEAHDEIYYHEGKFTRGSNRAGGIEGGIANGQELVFRAAMKPIPTLMKGLNTVNFNTKEPAKASTERSDVCAVPACEVVCESALLCEIAKVVSERLGGDTIIEWKKRYGELVL